MLTKRQELILKTIIQDFTQSHEPVGSKTVMQQLPIKVSSATIRNEMAVLEDQGLIEKTHSSSGRVPSARGYRYYLDKLVEPIQLPQKIYQQIGDKLNQPFHQVNAIIQEAAKILSDLTNYTAFAVGPEAVDVRVTGFRIVPVSSRQVMAILVTSDGNVRNQVYGLARGVSGEEIEKAVRLINDQLVGLPVSQITPELFAAISQHLGNTSHAGLLLDLVEDVFKDAASEQMYVDGQINLLNNPVETDVSDIKSLYELIDSDRAWSDWFDLPGQSEMGRFPVQVRLGPEMEDDLLKNYSLLTANYSVGEHGQGRIALLGPTNMPYSQMIGLLEFFRQALAEKLLDYYNGLQ
ncbi:MAG: heat-inducible transcriptional repressor HrcA [Lactobacillus sp.]|jgi:heat-inducible transcriptional repressor|nr:heat-inducible transcriptional repressor HrcA [Lactobacillus sp.]MCH3906173.1 heat-inducible transcriptional repressor HrcA [Lactobacillus sp.]MCH3990250.1 heat-inducible transcriptional repressor HrcA [Lactobacillus sp.]MCH4069036.1 heat-inducible transcriptional repressor HrcA [Lactobacillus sp.]MCI1303438.1 heat-inducible transcriptional repressor HrcA [Lactobacillus sp.]